MIGFTFNVHTWTLYQLTWVPSVMNKVKGVYQNISMSSAFVARKKSAGIHSLLAGKAENAPYLQIKKKGDLLILFHIVIKTKKIRYISTSLIMHKFIAQAFKKYTKSTWFHNKVFIENSKFLLNSCSTQYPHFAPYSLCLWLNDVL
jgi:hypothetical protein